MLSDAPTRAKTRSTTDELRLAGRHERAGLRHEADERHLAQVGGLAAHVRPGQDDELAVPAVELRVVGHERVGAVALDDRVPAVEDRQLVAVVDVRLDVVVQRGGFGERGEHVERGGGPRGVLDARRLGGDRGAQRLEHLDLALEDPLVGAEDLLFVLLERRRDEALAAGNRLLAVVVGRHRVQVRLRDLDVVAEDAVVADLERGDAGARALPLLHLGDHLLARRRDAPQVVELGVDAVADVAAVARQRRRLVDERRARWPPARRPRRRARRRGSTRAAPGTPRAAGGGGARPRATCAAPPGRAARRCPAPCAPPGARGRASCAARRGTCPARSCGTRSPRRHPGDRGCARARPAAGGATCAAGGRPWASRCGRARAAASPRGRRPWPRRSRGA